MSKNEHLGPPEENTASLVNRFKREDAAASWLEAIIESAEDGIISKTLAGIITSWNNGAQRIFGYTADEIIGKHVTVLFPPENVDEELHIISKIGRYRFFPISGTIIVTTGFFLFSHITATTNRAILGAWMFVLGFGIGQVMPVLTLAVQNAVERKDLGAATSSVVFFRSIGSSLGAAIFGAIILNRLTFHIGQVLPGAAGAQAAQSLKSSAAGLSKLSPQARADVLGAFAQSFHDVFLIAIPFAVTALLVALFLKEAPLRTSQQQVEAEALENTGHL